MAKKAKKKAGRKTGKKVVKKAARKVAKKATKQAARKTAGRVRVTLVRSIIGTIGKHRATVRGLGLRRLNHTVELEDSAAVRGMIRKVDYLVRVEQA